LKTVGFDTLATDARCSTNEHNMLNKTSLRNFIGELPLAAELDYALRQKNRARKDHYNLSRLQKSLPYAVQQVKPLLQNAKPGKNVLFFATSIGSNKLRNFLTHWQLGHTVTLTLPYSNGTRKLIS
jgi:hypothetical protein